MDSNNNKDYGEEENNKETKVSPSSELKESERKLKDENIIKESPDFNKNELNLPEKIINKSLRESKNIDNVKENKSLENNFEKVIAGCDLEKSVYLKEKDNLSNIIYPSLTQQKEFIEDYKVEGLHQIPDSNIEKPHIKINTLLDLSTDKITINLKEIKQTQ